MIKQFIQQLGKLSQQTSPVILALVLKAEQLESLDDWLSVWGPRGKVSRNLKGENNAERTKMFSLSLREQTCWRSKHTCLVFWSPYIYLLLPFFFFFIPKEK